MYYEEKIINGVLCYRTDPENEFKEITKDELTARYIAQDHSIGVLVSLLNGVLREYCGGPDEFETERNSEAQAVMFLHSLNIIELLQGTWPETRKVRFRFK
jgi:hypothetical protein